MLKKTMNYFTTVEKCLWIFSVLLIVVSFLIFDRSNFVTLISSLIGVTSLIFCAKGNPIGQVLMIIFCVFYGIVSYSFAYYGEMLTYLGMSMPMAVFALIAWLKNPYEGKHSEVKVNTISKKEIVFMCMLTIVVTVIFYFILKYLDTANLIPSTISVTTSFLAVYLTFRRSPYYAFGYALNDIVLIVLWVMATREDINYLSTVVCFVAFLFNDIYGFISWKNMQKRQAQSIA